MEQAQLTALIAGTLAQGALAWQAEQAARGAISGKSVDQIITELFPGVDSKLLTANKDVVNYLQQATDRYVRALTRGELNWEWEGPGDPPTAGDPGEYLNPQGRQLVQEATADILVSGKFAFLPSVDAGGRLRVATLSGFLLPVYAPGDTTEVMAVVQVTSRLVDGKVRYQVRRYTPGLIEVFDNLEDWQKYAAATPQPFEQPLKDRLPIAFRVVSRDVDREPQGIIRTALPAFRRYVKAAVLLGFIAHRGGFEERVAKSDRLFELARTDPRHELVASIKKVGPNTVRLMDSAGSYERLSPVTLSEYRNQERDARNDVLSALNIPQTEGADLAGVALAEKREAYTETVDSSASAIADALTEAHELAAALRPTLRPGFRVTLKPKFTRDLEGERLALREDFKAGMPESAYLSGLQSLGVAWITDEMVEAAQAREQLEAPAPLAELGG